MGTEASSHPPSDLSEEAWLVSRCFRPRPPRGLAGELPGAQPFWAGEGRAADTGQQADCCGPWTTAREAEIRVSSSSLAPSGEDVGKNLSAATWQSLARMVVKELQVINNICNNETKTITKPLRGAMNEC